jgi:deoxyribodipyrimidine photolyase-related protein
MNLLILPHQLYLKKYLPKEIETIYLYEHPQYFTGYKYNKKRIVMHRASMKYYEDYLKDNNYNVKYVEYNKSFPAIKDFYYFDPIDKIHIKGTNKTMLESPNFLLNKEDYQKYNEKSKSFIFNNFYMYSKKIVDIIPNVKSKDKDNRQTLSTKTKLNIPNLPLLSATDKKYITEAIKYTEDNFKNYYGNTDNYIFPVTHKTAEKWLNHFLDNKFKEFGPYQDFIVPGKNYMYHSILSPCINIGLLNPLEIIEKIKPLEKKIPINSYEGYIRQLFWREYQRYCYIHYNFDNKNYFGNTKKLTKEWYNGTTGITPVDDAIKDAFSTGYLHHIIRLMVVGNWMNLYGISPKQGFKWFMEFSCDSYEWVMCQNVLDMVFCVSGGDTMRKPYISSSNYIIKMSHYKKGDWSKEWDETFRKFCVKNKQKLWKFRYFFPFLAKMQ